MKKKRKVYEKSNANKNCEVHQKSNENRKEKRNGTWARSP